MRVVSQWALAWVLAAALTGCAARPQAVAADPPALAALRRQFDALPTQTILTPAGQAAGRPLHLAVREVGTGLHARVIVLVHGLLTDQHVWRYLGGALGGDYDLMLVELPGCGQSDKPDPAQVGDDVYSPRAMAGNVLAAVRERLAARAHAAGVPAADRQLPISNLTETAAGTPGDTRPNRQSAIGNSTSTPPSVALVGHSLGAAVVLNMLSDPDLRTEYADVLAHVDRAILLSPPDVAIVRPAPVFMEILNLTDTEACLGDAFGILESRVSRAVLGRAPAPNQPPFEEVENIAAVLADPARRHAAQAMIRRIAPNHDFQPDWPAIEKISAAYRAISVPVLLVCGARDEMAPSAMDYKLHAEINGSILRIVLRTGHFLPSECPALVAELIRRFMVTGGQGVSAFAEIPPDATAPPPDATAPTTAPQQKGLPRAD